MRFKAVFLDRDGVLNRAIVKGGKPYTPASLAELKIPEEAFLALSDLKKAGFLLIGATNQPDVARGNTDLSTVESLNAAILASLPLDTIRVCYHDDRDDCICRKPKPGLLLNAASDFQIDLSKSFMIGDRWKDIAAGQAAGCKTIWINHHYDENPTPKTPDYTVSNLIEAKDWILKQSGQEERS